MPVLLAFRASLRMLRVWPACSSPSLETVRPLASAMRHHRLLSPSTLRAMVLRVSPPTTV
ncbi:MAG: hypothetical protein BGO79_23370 [Delftia sp. 67-8]|nr:MAG: hypothetical protein BGO79_23370 [Delftia sp. 67-8]